MHFTGLHSELKTFPLLICSCQAWLFQVFTEHINCEYSQQFDTPQVPTLTETHWKVSVSRLKLAPKLHKICKYVCHLWMCLYYRLLSFSASLSIFESHLTDTLSVAGVCSFVCSWYKLTFNNWEGMIHPTLHWLSNVAANEKPCDF